MKNKTLEARLGDEVKKFIETRKSLQLSTVKIDGTPFASYAPFAIGDECLYVLLSEIAVHATNLQHNPKASVLILEDEDNCEELFARLRVNYSIDAEMQVWDSEEWHQGLKALADRHGERIINLSDHEDFKLFKLKPTGGRYVKGFARAYSLLGGTLSGEAIDAMNDGHKRREVA